MNQDIRNQILAILLMAAWVGLFFYCAHTPSRAAIEGLAELSGGERIVACFQILFTWAWTNLFFLCVLAAAAGDIASSRQHRTSAAMTRGFFIFLAAISGQVLFMGSVQFHLQSQEDYFRIAGSLSLLSFLVGFNPRFFSNLIQRAESSMISDSETRTPAPVPDEQMADVHTQSQVPVS